MTLEDYEEMETFNCSFDSNESKEEADNETGDVCSDEVNSKNPGFQPAHVQVRLWWSSILSLII